MFEKCIKIYVEGIVQGVCFRASTKKEAENRNICGYAKNLIDGRVEVLACGQKQLVDELVDWLYQGPEFATVTRLDIEKTDQVAPVGFVVC